MNPDWNERYSAPEFAYGESPNVFFSTWLIRFQPGAILMAAEGEGRNAVFAASKGWDVTAFDLSIEGKHKAELLAKQHNVQVDYQVGDFQDLQFEPHSFDAIGLIYAHFAGDKKMNHLKRLETYLKPGGVVIFEAFSKNHLPFRLKNPKVGGPMDLDVLFSVAELTDSFGHYEQLTLGEEVVELNEGKYHNGTGSVLRFVGRKPQNQ